MSEPVVSELTHNRSPLRKLVQWRESWLTIDRNASAISFAKSDRGIVALHAVFFLILIAGKSVTPLSASIIVGLIACAVFPHRRIFVIGASTLVIMLLHPYRESGLASIAATQAERMGVVDWAELTTIRMLAVGTFLAFAWFALAFQRHYRWTPPARRPVLSLLLIFGGLVLLANLRFLGAPAQMFLWSFIGITASSFWYLAYALADQKAKDPTPPALRMGFFRPFWGGTLTPVGKGAGYLGKFEAKDATELAVTRLKALKLLTWGTILGMTLDLAHRLIYGAFGLTTFDNALALQMANTPLPISICWASLVVYFLLDLLSMAAWGHVLVSTIRMAGYRIPRNTVRPMSARTLAEFWNRYYFYFKELLVDFFFYPAFVRWFKTTPRLRLAVATFSAACVGNVLYHFMREIHLVANFGYLEALIAFQNYAFYALILALGLIVSQLRGRKPAAADGFVRYNVLPRINVALFFCLLHVFDDVKGLGTVADRIGFLFHLFGVT